MARTMNQDEGEFKKRIYELIFRFPTGDGYVVYDQKLLGLLDEAHKDLESKAKTTIDITSMAEPSKTLKTQEFWYEKWVRWSDILKWFGSEAQK